MRTAWLVQIQLLSSLSLFKAGKPGESRVDAIDRYRVHRPPILRHQTDAVEPADFRKGIDGLAGLCKRTLKADPFSGTLFIFRNRKETSLKLLLYDGQGFWLCQKRLSSGRFVWWPGMGGEKIKELAVHELQLLLWNSKPAESTAGEMWKRITPLQI